MELGFDLAGIASAEKSSYADHYRAWIAAGKSGTMNWLSNRVDERTDSAVYFPGAASAICVAINYHAPLKPAPAEEPSYQGRIARYALGDDYHDLIKTRLFKLSDWLKRRVPTIETRCGVDTAPIMERELAARAGIGWIGKNTCIINPRVGSWLLLGEILTTLPLPVDEPVADHCGACTRCIDACPTHAITEPYSLDATRCISYLTIEHRSEIPEDLKSRIDDWLYGCDVCQEVCPHNGRAPSAIDEALRPRFVTGTLDVREVMNWTDETYRSTLRDSAMKRVKLPVLKRNAEIVAQNQRGSGDDA